MPIIKTLNTVLIELASTSEDLTNSDIDKKYPADSESVRTQIDRSNEKMLLTNKAIFKAGSKAYDEIMSLKENLCQGPLLSHVHTPNTWSACHHGLSIVRASWDEWDARKGIYVG